MCITARGSADGPRPRRTYGGANTDLMRPVCISDEWSLRRRRMCIAARGSAGGPRPRRTYRGANTDLMRPVCISDEWSLRR
jgi:hypothetical protein